MCFLNFFHFCNFLYCTGGSHKRLGPEVIYLLLSILTGLGALIYALINALKKLTHCVKILYNFFSFTSESIITIFFANFFVCMFKKITKVG